MSDLAEKGLSVAGEQAEPTNILIVDDLPEKHLVFASILD